MTVIFNINYSRKFTEMSKLKKIINKILNNFFFEDIKIRDYMEKQISNEAIIIDLKTDEEIKQFADAWAKKYSKKIKNHIQ